MNVSNSIRSSSSDRLNVDFSNNLNDDFIDESEVDMDVDGADDISVRDVAPDFCERFVGIEVSISVDSDSDHGGDIASLSIFSDSETQDLPEENDECLEENESEVASNHSLFGSDRGGVVLNAEQANLLVVLDDELVNVPAEYEGLEVNQEELVNPVENEEHIEEVASDVDEVQIEENQFEVASDSSVANVSSLLRGSDADSMVDEEDLAINFDENEEELEINQLELANPVENEEYIEEVASNFDEEQIEVNQAEVASENGLASITDLLVSSEDSSDDEGWIFAPNDDDFAEAMAEDVDEEVFVDDDVIMIDLVSNSTSESSAIQDVE